MPKLPTWQNLSAVTPQAAGPASISPGAASGIADAYRRVGKGIESGLSGLGAALKKSEDEKNAEDAINAHTGYQRDLHDLQRRYQTDNDYETYDERFTAEEAKLREKWAGTIGNEKARQKFVQSKAPVAESARNGILNRGLNLKKEKHRADIFNSLQTQADIYSKPQASDIDKEVARLGGRGTIKAGEDAGWLTPGEAAEARNKFERGIYLREHQNRISAGDAAGLREDIRVYLKDIAKGKAARMGSDRPFEIQQYDGERKVGRNRNKPVRGVIAHYTEGGTSMDGLASWANQSNTGYNYYIDRDGNVIEFAGDDVVMNHAGAGRRRPGDKAPHLGNGNTIGIGIMTPKGGKATPEQIEAFRRLTGELSKKHGFSQKDIYGHGEVAVGHRKSTEAMDVVGAVRDQGFAGAEGEAGPAGPRDGEQPKDDVTPQEAGEMPPQEIQRREELARKFDPLKPEDIYQLQAAAERATKIQTRVARTELRKQLASNYANIRQDGVPSDGFDISQVPKDMQPEVEKEIKRSYVFHDATKDAGELSEQQMQSRLAELHKTLKKPGDPDRKQNDDLYRDIEREYEAVQKVRTNDPAAAVDSHPAVEAVMGTMYAGMQDREQWEELIAARREAQRELGIDPQRILTRAEARQLLPNMRSANPSDVRDILYQAAIRAQETYGPDNAKEALLDALHFQGYTSKENAGPTVIAALKASPLEAGDVRYIERNLRLNQEFGEDRFMEADDEFATDRRIASDEITPLPMTPIDGVPGMGEQRPMPTVAAFERAKQSGSKGAAAFDKLYGGGAFKRAEKYLSEQGR